VRAQAARVRQPPAAGCMRSDVEVTWLWLKRVKECVMDFIERIFGFAPDGGSGTLEFLLFAIPIAGIAYLAARRRQRARRKP
jgi:hypothetical protein